MSAAPNGPDQSPVDPVEPSSTEPSGDDLVSVTARLRPADVERLDIAATRRGIEREDIMVQAVDAFLAREMWSGGFIAPPPPMEPPSRFPWGPKAFRLRTRD